ncbi:EamA family transporter [Devosia sp.]|uniref:EamA family transporter n=1 Tax=Devosia sp. TaxID=1871048 RepID=UPI002F0A05C2
MSLRHLLLAFGVVTVWGLNFVAIRWGVDEVPPLLLTALRFALAAVPAVFFIRPPKVGLALLVAYGFAIGVLQFGLLFVAISLGMPAGLSSVVMQVQAFFTIGLAVAFLGERPGLLQLAGAVVAFAGIGVIGLERLQGAALLPLLMTIAAALFWGIGNIITKKAGAVDMLSFVVWSSLVPPLPLLLASLLLEGPGALPQALVGLTWLGAGSLLFIAYASTLFGYGGWSVLLQRYPANLVAPFALLVPITGIGGAALLLGETISAVEIAGSVLVFAGLLLNVFGPRLWGRLRPRAAPAP